jgi:hypothetical protein
LWNDTEAEVVHPEGITEEELKKREDEEKKKAAEETEETQTQAKRRGAKLYIYGNGFLNDPNLMVSFIWSGSVTKKVKPIYKNTKKLAIEVPDMGTSVEIGTHQLVVEVTTNGQQYTQNGVSFTYNHIDPNLTDEDLRKMEEEEAKNNKKGAKKK